MRLADLIDKSYMRIYGNGDIEISGLTDNSLFCKKGDLFFAIDGTKVDGKKFAIDAVKNGAVAVVSRKKNMFAQWHC